MSFVNETIDRDTYRFLSTRAGSEVVNNGDSGIRLLNVRKVELLLPDRETPAASLAFELKDGRIEFTAPNLICYDVIVLN
jgi:hypothetical protein